MKIMCEEEDVVSNKIIICRDNGEESSKIMSSTVRHSHLPSQRQRHYPLQHLPKPSRPRKKWISDTRRYQQSCPSALTLFLCLLCHHIKTTIGFYIASTTTTIEHATCTNLPHQRIMMGVNNNDHIIYNNKYKRLHNVHRERIYSIFGLYKGAYDYNTNNSRFKMNGSISALKATRDRSKTSAGDNETLTQNPDIKAKRRKASKTVKSDEERNELSHQALASSSLKTNNQVSSSITTSTSTSKNFTIPDITLFRKEKQKRRKLKQPRRPSSFWADMKNIESELRQFWSTLNVPIASDKPPPIPNEALLNHFERHDLRYAIANMGGRDVVSERLNGAKLIPGKWTQAVTTCKEVQYLLHPSNPAGRGLSEDVPPLAPYVMRTLKKQRLKMKKKEMKAKQERMKKEKESIHNVLGGSSICTNNDEKDHVLHDNINDNDDNIDIEDDEIVGQLNSLRFMGGQRWAHSSQRNPRGHWSQDVIIQELYQYLSHVKEEKGRPSVWMPRPSELATEGRNDLKQAMMRFGGSAKTCTLAKLVPYRDWRYFESTLELYVELLKYLIQYHDGEETVFPKLADIQEKGHQRLYDLIMEYGGRKIIATRLDMEFQAQTKLDLFKGMSFGPFSLDFAVRLMYFIRNDMIAKEPPLEQALIQMPTKQYLLEKGEIDLAKEVSIYGGHESIARRLNLAFDVDEAKREKEGLP